jgi:hypothetical protein
MAQPTLKSPIHGRIPFCTFYLRTQVSPCTKNLAFFVATQVADGVFPEEQVVVALGEAGLPRVLGIFCLPHETVLVVQGVVRVTVSGGVSLEDFRVTCWYKNKAALLSMKKKKKIGAFHLERRESKPKA